MHELKICLDIIVQLEQYAKVHQFKQIKTLWLEIGELAGIEIDALCFSFPIAAKNTLAQSAKLEIIQIQGQAFCTNCQKTIKINHLFDACGYCLGYNYKITQGMELKIAKVEIN